MPTRQPCFIRLLVEINKKTNVRNPNLIMKDLSDITIGFQICIYLELIFNINLFKKIYFQTFYQLKVFVNLDRNFGQRNRMFAQTTFTSGSTFVYIHKLMFSQKTKLVTLLVFSFRIRHPIYFNK